MVPPRLFTTVLLAALTAGLSLARPASARTPTTTIRGRLRLPDDTPLNTTRITLNDGERTTYTQPDGSFAFHRVGPGVHLLDVQSHAHMFSHVKIQLLEAAVDQPKCIEYAFPGASKQAIPHPLLLTAHARFEYFEPRPGFSVLSMLKNPMLLMMIFSAGLMFFMPKMMENLDDDQKQQMQKQMEMQSDPTKMLSHLWGELSGGGGDGAALEGEQGRGGGGGGDGEGGGGGGGAKKGGKGGKSTRRSKRD